MFAAFDDSEDDEPDLGGTAPDADPPVHPSPDPQDLQQPVAPINPGRAQLDMRKVMFTAGGPDYDRVLQETDVHIGADASNIPSERCGGEARRANLKRKARHIARSVAETFAYCSMRTVSIEEAAEILQTFGNVRIIYFRNAWIIWHLYSMNGLKY